MPLLWLSLAFLLGILLGSELSWTLDLWLLLAAAALSLSLLLQVRIFSHLTLPLFRILTIAPLPYRFVLLALALGAAWFQRAQPQIDPTFIAWYNDLPEKFVIEAVLVEPPDVRDTYANLRLEVEELRPRGDLLFKPVEGLMLARVSPVEDWRYGDRLRIEGYLETPPADEEFSYRDYLARQGVYAYMRNAEVRLLQHGEGSPFLRAVYALKERALDTVYRLWPDPEASLMAGILLGVESGIPAPVQQAFKDTGTSHVIAISGFNMTILSGLFTSIFLRILGKARRFHAAFLSAAGIGVYTILVGADAAVVRAAVMGGLAIFARQIGRRQDGINSLAFVAVVMALFNPHVLWDVGFQLSFAATMGLILYAEPFAQAFLRFASRYLPSETAQRLTGPVGEYFLFTFAAQLMTLPVTVYHFQRFSWSSLLANPVILPVQSPVMVLGGLAVLLALVVQPLGQLAAYAVWPSVGFTIRAVELFARIPAGSIVLGQVSWVVVIGFYALLLGFTFAPKLRESGGRISSLLSKVPSGLASAALAGAALLAVLVWRTALAAPDGLLHLTVLDVGSGDALLIQTPGGRHLLVDGGPSPSALSDALGRRLPFFNRRLDWLVVAGIDEPQIGGLPRTLERFPPQQALWSGAPLGTYSARSLQTALGKAGVPIYNAQIGHTLDLGQGAALRVLSAGRRGAVLLLEWGSFRALLPIGPDVEDLEALQGDTSLHGVTALLLGESGYAPANPPEWIARLNPQVVLLSVAAGDRDGRPDERTLQAVQDYTLLRTDKNGWIELSTDGEQMWVEVEGR